MHGWMGKMLHVDLSNGNEHIVLGLEEIVEGAPRDIGGVGYLIQRDHLEPPALYEPLGCLQDPLTHPRPPAFDPARFSLTPTPRSVT